MREFKQRQQLKKRIYSWPVIVILVIILFFVLNGTWGVFQKYRLSREALEVSQGKHEELEKKKESVLGDIEHIDTESGMEEELRVQFNVAKEGEQTIVIVDEEKKVEEVDEEESLVDKIRSWFGGGS